MNHLGAGGRGGSFGNWISVLGFSICRVGGIRPGMPPLEEAAGAAAGRLGFCRLSLSRAGLNSSEGILEAPVGLLAAKSLSAIPPCFSPLVSFLMAYWTLICLPLKYCPCI